MAASAPKGERRKALCGFCSPQLGPPAAQCFPIVVPDQASAPPSSFLKMENNLLLNPASALP